MSAQLTVNVDVDKDLRELLLMRHAKSSWTNPHVEDHDRPLNERGLVDAPRMAAWLLQHHLRPQLILSSTALRARETAGLVSTHCGGIPIVESRDLYHASPETLQAVLGRIVPSIRRVMIVAHNPGMEELVRLWSGEPAFEMPTAAIGYFRYSHSTWETGRNLPENVAPPRLMALVRPKETNGE